MNVDGSAQVRLGHWNPKQKRRRLRMEGSTCPQERARAREISPSSSLDFLSPRKKNETNSKHKKPGRRDPQEPFPARLRPRRGRFRRLQAREGEPDLLDRQGAGEKID